MPNDKEIKEKIEKIKEMLNIFFDFNLIPEFSSYAEEKLFWVNDLLKLKDIVETYRNTADKKEKVKITTDISKVLLEIERIQSLNFDIKDLYTNKSVYDGLDFDQKFDDCSKEINLLINKWFAEASFENKIKFVFGDGFYDYEAKNNNFNSEPCQKYVSLNSELISELNKEINKKNDIDFYIRMLEYKNKYGHENKIIAALEIFDENKKKI